MNKQVCKYSIIRFQPYPETEEFANIGIVLYATAAKRLEFRLLDSKQHARITDFFDPSCKAALVQTAKMVRLQAYLAEQASDGADMYADLTRSREDIVRFSNSRVLFCTDPAATVDTLFAHYINRSFIREPSHEDRMKRQVRDLLERYNLGEQYKEGIIGEADKYEVRFPFVCQASKKTIIKPIHFKHEKPSQLIDHGLAWLGKIQQLRKYHFIKPDDILFTYAAPNADQAKLSEAFYDIKSQIESEGIAMTDINRPEFIVDFANSKAPAIL